jgi:hypothetical protein
MSGRPRTAAAARLRALRMGLLASKAFDTVLIANDANAACRSNPRAIGDIATCTGATTDQGPAAR